MCSSCQNKGRGVRGENMGERDEREKKKESTGRMTKRLTRVAV